MGSVIHVTGGNERGRTGRLWLAALLACAGVGAVAAQTALDANLSATGGRVNAPRAQMSMAAPLYTVNYSTGEMQYNRANAYRDPTYDIFQRYTLDRNQYFYANMDGQPRGSSYQNPYQSVRQGAARPQSMRSVRTPTRAVGPAAGTSARAPSYSAIRATPPNAGMSGMRQPSYRAGGVGAASSGRVNTRVGARRF